MMIEAMRRRACLANERLTISCTGSISTHRFVSILLHTFFTTMQTVVRIIRIDNCRVAKKKLEYQTKKKTSEIHVRIQNKPGRNVRRAHVIAVANETVHIAPLL